MGSSFTVKKSGAGEITVAIAGNPNVGKSTLFNALTGLNQHTGNWPGKTVSGAQGRFSTARHKYILVDIPGAYSLTPKSAEEEIARDFLCFAGADAVTVVCDATCLERNLLLALQIMQITANVIICVNLMDEARKKGVTVNLEKLSRMLGAKAVGTVASDKKSLDAFKNALDEAVDEGFAGSRIRLSYTPEIEKAADLCGSALAGIDLKGLDARWLSLRLLEDDASLYDPLKEFLGFDILGVSRISQAVREARQLVSRGDLEDIMASRAAQAAREAAKACVNFARGRSDARDRRLDAFATGRFAAYPIMLALLAVVLWLTVAGSNVPSEMLSRLFAAGGRSLGALFAGAPAWLKGVLIDGVFAVVGWVVSVMLPPMAIFFPLFTLLEDSGYLPRVAYNLDRPFKCCRACGKQCLTMMMGLGCNAVGVTGCRIIDSPRERLLAILTNSLVPCNGRFPTLIAVITMFFAGASAGGLVPALILTLVLIAGVAASLAATGILSATVLKGAPSAFTLELPPYRRPRVCRVVVRSLLDRTVFVLGRAALAAAPAGAVIWIMANAGIGGSSLLEICAEALRPAGAILGLDGVILMAFILGLPANETVIPIIIMAYMSTGSLASPESLEDMRRLFVENGWTWTTAVSMTLFTLFHWPCSTTILTVKKETGSWKWAALAAAVPTVIGIAACAIFTFAARACGWAAT